MGSQLEQALLLVIERLLETEGVEYVEFDRPSGVGIRVEMGGRGYEVRVKGVLTRLQRDGGDFRFEQMAGLRAEGMTQMEIGKRFGVHRSRVSQILRGGGVCEGGRGRPKGTVKEGTCRQ